MATRILIADDHNMVSEVLSALLAREDDMEVVAVADNGRDAVRLADELKPDIVVMDLEMPGMNGVEACRRIDELSPDSRVIVLSMYTEREYIVESLKAGAKGYVQKRSAFKTLVGAIRDVMENNGYLDPKITEIIVRDYVQQSHELPLQHEQPTLSDREREVLQLIAEGKNTKEIASKLDISTKTVEAHRRQVMLKLKMSNIAELTRYAIREGVTRL